MRITISHYGKKIQWENEYGIYGRETPIGRLDETTVDDIIPIIAALLITAGYQEGSIKTSMYDYGSEDLSEEV
jgi:hypothetical protein